MGKINFLIKTKQLNYTLFKIHIFDVYLTWYIRQQKKAEILFTITHLRVMFTLYRNQSIYSKITWLVSIW